jgi:acetyl-CoA carboxylase biotin carboxylase subunit
VEHPITEAVTGLDFVRAQIEIAKGATVEAAITVVATPAVGPTPAVELDFSRAIGHAIEVRVYAENPDEGFLPSPGRITHLQVPSGPGIRDDSGAYEGWTVPTAYDPLVSKVIAWAPDRSGAIRRMVRALTEYDVRGISTTIAFCRDLVASPAFAAAEFDTTYVDRLLGEHDRKGATSDQVEEVAAIAAALFEMARLKSSPARSMSSTARSITNAAGSVTSSPDSVGRDLRRADSLWAQRARVESLR